MCGIGAIVGETTGVLELLFPMTNYLYRRGEDGFGIALVNPATGEIFQKPFIIKGHDERDIDRDKAHFLKGVEAEAYRIGATMALVQAKYSTKTTMQKVDEDSLRRNMQPLLLEYPNLEQRCVGIHNGEVRDYAIKPSITITAASEADVDSRFLIEVFHQQRILLNDDWRAARWVMEQVKPGENAFTFGYSDGHGLLVMKDGMGIRPGCIGRKGDIVIITSESGFFEEAYGGFEREMLNGEVVRFDANLQLETRQVVTGEARPCGFEDFYFKDWLSRDFTGELSVGNHIRFKMGREMAWFYVKQHEGIDIIMGAPNSGRSYAEGASYELHIPCMDIARKTENRRYFLRRMGHKYSIDRVAVQGKNVAVYEDSLVRGDTIPQLYYHLKRNGAKQV